MDRAKIYNANVITPLRVIHGHVVIENGKIVRVSEGDTEIGDGLSIDAGGRYIAPGFIDIHVHGGGGHDFLDNTVEAYLGAAEMHVRFGTTALSPTITTCSKAEMRDTCEVYKEAKAKNANGSQFIGLHLEGPYFALSQSGAQDPAYIRNPDPAEYIELLNLSDDIVRWSAAPELNGALEFGRELRERGILAAIAHTDAVYEQVLEAFECGFTLMTHLYNGMSGVKRIQLSRHAGVVESAFIINGMNVEIIADGCHLAPGLLKLVYQVVGPARTVLITDAVRPAGLREGESILGSLRNGRKVIVEDGVVKLPDRSSFAGSAATADRLIRTMVNLADVPLHEAVRMMTSTPASIIGIDRYKGSLVPGKDADIVMFDKEINIQMTMIRGKIVYDRNTGSGTQQE